MWKGGTNHRHSSECVDSYCLKETVVDYVYVPKVKAKLFIFTLSWHETPRLECWTCNTLCV